MFAMCITSEISVLTLLVQVCWLVILTSLTICDMYTEGDASSHA
jgi:hypothetical protein